jgi:phosphoserine phosphatase RsbU/P
MPKENPRLLVVEPSSGCADLLREQGFHSVDHATGSTALDKLTRHSYELVLLDTAAFEAAELDLFVKAQAAARQSAFMLLVGPDEEKLGRDALRLGAQDFLDREKLRGSVLALSIRKALDRHHALDASRQDQHLLEILMDKIPDSIYFKDTESRFLRVNHAQARRFNLTSPALAIGKTDADFFSDAHARQARKDEQDTMRSGQPLVGIQEMETWPDGTISWVSTTKMPLRDPSGRVIGTFGISRDITSRKLAELALEERTRQLQQKNQQIEEQLRMARELQRAMLPQRFPCLRSRHNGEDNALEFLSFYHPCGTVSGDFYDVVALSDTSVGVFICDVMGHDVRAALVTAMMRSLVEDLSRTCSEPGELLSHINQGLASVFEQTGTTMFATAFYLIADVANAELRYSSAAHPDALCLSRTKGTVESLGQRSHRKGPALGLFSDAVFPTFRRSLVPGDLIMLFTDGLIEAEGANHECFSQERLTACLRKRIRLPAQQMLQEVLSEIRQFCGRGEFTDDVSLLGMEFKDCAVPATLALS